MFIKVGNTRVNTDAIASYEPIEVGRHKTKMRLANGDTVDTALTCDELDAVLLDPIRAAYNPEAQ